MVTLLVLHGSSRDETDLAAFAVRAAPDARLILPRGGFRDGEGHTFFRRNRDRSIPVEGILDVARQWLSDAGCPLLGSPETVVLVGYSSGAIFAEALLAVMPHRFSAAILLRPEPLATEFAFPKIAGMPILLVAGLRDERRRPEDAMVLARQLRAAQADVTMHSLDCGHGWAPLEEDLSLTRSWLSGFAVS